MMLLNNFWGVQWVGVWRPLSFPCGSTKLLGGDLENSIWIFFSLSSAEPAAGNL